MTVPYESLYEKVQIILKSKIEEFQYFGYKSITEQELWRFCIDKVWRKRDVQTLRLYELAAGILSVSASEIISYLQMTGLKEQQINTEIMSEELNSLFKSLPIALSKNNEQ